MDENGAIATDTELVGEMSTDRENMETEWSESWIYENTVMGAWPQ